MTATAAPIAQISRPQSGDHVDGLVTISGTADDAHFDSYVLEAQGGGPFTNFIEFGIGLTRVRGGVLGVWDTAGFIEGPISIRMTVYDQNLTSSVAIVP